MNSSRLVSLFLHDKECVQQCTAMCIAVYSLLLLLLFSQKAACRPACWQTILSHLMNVCSLLTWLVASNTCSVLGSGWPMWADCFSLDRRLNPLCKHPPNIQHTSRSTVMKHNTFTVFSTFSVISGFPAPFSLSNDSYSWISSVFAWRRAQNKSSSFF